MTRMVTLEEVLLLAERLPPIEKLRLIEHLLPHIEQEFRAMESRPSRLKRGVWRGLNLREEEITEVRREMWGGFPREI